MRSRRFTPDPCRYYYWHLSLQLPSIGVPLDDYPKLSAWSERLIERSAWQKTQPTPDAIALPGGHVLAPGNPDRPVQFIDVRDLAEWAIAMVEAQAVGIYNATGPNYHLTMERLLEACKVVSSRTATFTWVDEEFLEANGVEPWLNSPRFEKRGFGTVVTTWAKATLRNIVLP